MYSIGIAASLLGVCVKTLRRWDKAKKIKCARTPGGHRRFPIQEIRRILEGKALIKNIEGKNPSSNDKCAIYGRVSSHKQNKRGDLARQIEVLKQYAYTRKLRLHNIYKDVGSGLNTNRKGLWRLIRNARKGAFSKIIVTYKDRLTRFGYKYLKNYLSEFGVQILSLNEMEIKTPETELVEDLVTIIQSFSGKLYGMRSHKNLKKSSAVSRD